jgi:hypothetical protein
MYKICSKCKQEKLFSDFSRDKDRKDGHYPQCKICRKGYRTDNKDKIKSSLAAYRLENKDKIAAQVSEYGLKYRIANRDKIASRMEEYYQDNKEYYAEYWSKYYQDNKEYYAAYSVEYRQTNRDKINANTAKRRATKLMATPTWLTKEEIDEIYEYYTCAQMFKLYTGQEYHVDHIVPLQGENVCGLHVPWNLQVISARENRIKSNKLMED